MRSARDLVQLVHAKHSLFIIRAHQLHLVPLLTLTTVIAGFFTGGSLAIRGGYKASRNSAIACGCLLAVIEGVGIAFQRMMADNTRLDVSELLLYHRHRESRNSHTHPTCICVQRARSVYSHFADTSTSTSSRNGAQREGNCSLIFRHALS